MDSGTYWQFPALITSDLQLNGISQSEIEIETAIECSNEWK